MLDLGTPVPVTAGSVQFTTSTLAVGTHTIAATYSGDPKYDPSVSNAVNQVVGAAGDADLRVTGSASSTAAILVGSTTMVTFTLTNAGPSSVFNTALIATMTGGATVSSAAPSQGTCTMTPAISCSLGTLPAGGTATVSLSVTLPATSGPVSFTGTVSSTSPDPDGTSNSATVWLQVLTPLQIPTLDPRMLALLAIGFIAVAVRMMR